MARRYAGPRLPSVWLPATAAILTLWASPATGEAEELIDGKPAGKKGVTAAPPIGTLPVVVQAFWRLPGQPG
jgi:hypothetical protein